MTEYLFPGYLYNAPQLYPQFPAGSQDCETPVRMWPPVLDSEIRVRKMQFSNTRCICEATSRVIWGQARCQGIMVARADAG